MLVLYKFKVIIKYSPQTRVMVGKYHLKGLGIGGFTRRRPVNNFTTDLSSSSSIMMNTVSTDTPLKTIKTTTTAKIPSKRRRIEVDDDVDSDNDDVDLKELENDDDTNEDDDDERDEKMMVGKDLDDASDELYAEGGCRSMWGNRAGRRFGPPKKKKKGGGKRGGKKKRGRPKGSKTKRTTKIKRGKKGTKKKSILKIGKAKRAVKDMLDSVL